jgi:hypothetical protein
MRMGRPKQTQVKEVFPVRLPAERLRALQDEAGTRAASASDVVRMHLERYVEIVWRDLPRLSPGEWCAVFDALGAAPAEISALAWVGTSIARTIDDDLARKWKVDAAELAKAAQAWTFGQGCAVADAAVRFRAAVAEGAVPIEAAREATTRAAVLVLDAPKPSQAPKPKAKEPKRTRR